MIIAKVPVNRHHAVLEDKHRKEKKLVLILLVKLTINFSSKEEVVIIFS